ncbi:MAG: glycerate kinase [Verrucomicrobia bacterium]|nr:glycerate kinase [Verrucomicrobiota bacterium]
MSLRILIVPDKFKGTLTAQAAARFIAQGWREARPGDALTLLPMSDGGDGFGEVMRRLLGARARLTRTINAAHQPIETKWWGDVASQTAIIESAQVIGLALLPPGKFHPFDLDTCGLGAVLVATWEREVEHVLVGIGGSATNDGGFGVARAMGWSFLDAAGRALERWTDLTALAHVRPPPVERWPRDFVVAVDVQNPLLGPTGASRIYGPQKGLRPEDCPLAEACLGRLTEIVRQDLQLDIAAEPGAGAAGGLGFGLRSFFGARLESGFHLFARYAKLETHIRASDLVITGEGTIDASTLMGKGVGEIARLCQTHRVPCLGLAGMLNESALANGSAPVFTRLHGIAPELTTPEKAKAGAAFWLMQLATHAANDWR